MVQIVIRSREANPSASAPTAQGTILAQHEPGVCKAVYSVPNGQYLDPAAVPRGVFCDPNVSLLSLHAVSRPLAETKHADTGEQTQKMCRRNELKRCLELLRSVNPGQRQFALRCIRALIEDDILSGRVNGDRTTWSRGPLMDLIGDAEHSALTLTLLLRCVQEQSVSVRSEALRLWYFLLDSTNAQDWVLLFDALHRLRDDIGYSSPPHAIALDCYHGVLTLVGIGIVGGEVLQDENIPSQNFDSNDIRIPSIAEDPELYGSSSDLNSEILCDVIAALFRFDAPAILASIVVDPMETQHPEHPDSDDSEIKSSTFTIEDQIAALQCLITLAMASSTRRSAESVWNAVQCAHKNTHCSRRTSDKMSLLESWFLSASTQSDDLLLHHTRLRWVYFVLRYASPAVRTEIWDTAFPMGTLDVTRWWHNHVLFAVSAGKNIHFCLRRYVLDALCFLKQLVLEKFIDTNNLQSLIAPLKNSIEESKPDVFIQRAIQSCFSIGEIDCQRSSCAPQNGEPMIGPWSPLLSRIAQLPSLIGMLLERFQSTLNTNITAFDNRDATSSDVDTQISADLTRGKEGQMNVMKLCGIPWTVLESFPRDTPNGLLIPLSPNNLTWFPSLMGNTLAGNAGSVSLDHFAQTPYTPLQSIPDDFLLLDSWENAVLRDDWTWVHDSLPRLADLLENFAALQRFLTIRQTRFLRFALQREKQWMIRHVQSWLNAHDTLTTRRNLSGESVTELSRAADTTSQAVHVSPGAIDHEHLLVRWAYGISILLLPHETSEMRWLISLMFRCTVYPNLYNYFNSQVAANAQHEGGRFVHEARSYRTMRYFRGSLEPQKDWFWLPIMDETLAKGEKTYTDCLMAEFYAWLITDCDLNTGKGFVFHAHGHPLVTIISLAPFIPHWEGRTAVLEPLFRALINSLSNTPCDETLLPATWSSRVHTLCDQRRNDIDEHELLAEVLYALLAYMPTAEDCLTIVALLVTIPYKKLGFEFLSKAADNRTDNSPVETQHPRADINHQVALRLFYYLQDTPRRCRSFGISRWIARTLQHVCSGHLEPGSAGDEHLALSSRWRKLLAEVSQLLPTHLDT